MLTTLDKKWGSIPILGHVSENMVPVPSQKYGLVALFEFGLNTNQGLDY